MKLEDLAVDLRPRSPWEAMDLGLALARTHAKALFLVYGLALLPFVLLAMVLALAFPFTAMLSIWWFKPVWERFALHVLAQGAFGVKLSWAQVFAAWRTIPRTGLLSQLLPWRRLFDWGRSFHSPVFQLEGQKSKAARARFLVLDKRAGGHATWLTVAFVHFEVVVWAGLIACIFFFMPDDVRPRQWSEWVFNAARGDDADVRPWVDALEVLLSGIAMVIIEPFYVAAGFALYLNRRTQLEGWDLELAFKRMDSRLKTLAQLGVAALCVALLCALTVAPSTSFAQTQSASKSIDVAPATLEKVLKTKEFEQYETTKTWQPRNPKADERAPDNEWLQSLAKLFGYFSEIGRVLLWIVAISLGAWLLYWLAMRFGWAGLFERRAAPATPESLFGLDIRPESLPDDVATAARKLAEAGDLRGALSLLYRGALSSLVQRRALEVKAGYTEGDCARQVAVAMPASLSSYFGQLIGAWQTVAYAKLNPALSDVLSLCNAWAQHFAVAPARSETAA